MLSGDRGYEIACDIVSKDEYDISATAPSGQNDSDEHDTHCALELPGFLVPCGQSTQSCTPTLFLKKPSMHAAGVVINGDTFCFFYK